MNYLLKSRDDKKSSVRSSILIAVYITAGLLLFSLIFNTFSRKVFLSLGDSIWNGEGALASVAHFGLEGFFNGHDLALRVSEYEKMEEEWNTYKAEIADLKDEISILKDALGRASSSPFVMAGVLKAPPFLPYDTFIIDAGSSNGLVKGQKVFAKESYIIGEIAEVHNGNAKVKLYSTAGEKMSVRVGSSTELYEATGRGGGEFSITVHRTDLVSSDDLVKFPGIDEDVVGKISDIENDSAKVFKEVFFRFPFSLSNIDKVLVKIE